MNFTYTAEGGLRLGGCACVSHKFCFQHRFEVGAKLFICDKASLEGKLKPVVIKHVLINFDHGQPIFIYRETLNRCFLEEELCTKQEAIDLALEFCEDQEEKAIEFLESLCGPSG